MSLYQKYRPKNFSEVVGQDHIKQTLINAINFDRISHAYLFSGPHGVGKTSIARILACASNCLAGAQKPCGECQNCASFSSGNDLNIIEIDAASNRGIDNIRDLKEKVAFPPQGAKRKVYIIDEIHMLSKEAFNALLKTLEEPPKHSLFILATTEIHKVLDTIISRTQHFELKKISIEQIVEHLKKVATTESIELQHDAAHLIAMHSGGSLRDSLSLLDQIKNYNSKIDLDSVRFIVGLPREQELLNLIDAYFKKDSSQLLSLVRSFSGNGYDINILINQLIEIARGIIYTKNNLKSEFFLPVDVSVYSTQDAIELINDLIIAKAQMDFVALPQIPFELALLRQGHQAENKPILSVEEQGVGIVDTKKEDKNGLNSESQSSIVSKRDTQKIEPAYVHTEIVSEATELKKTNTSESIVDWEDFLNRIRVENMKLSSLLASANFSILDNVLEIQVPFKFYAERIEEPTSKSVIKKVFKDLTQKDVEIVAKLSSGEIEPKVNPEIANSQLEAIKEVFAGVIR